MENTPNQERKFVSLDNVSKFLYCSICDDIFRNPIRLKTCGHTYCIYCILEWCKHNTNCPLCRVEFTEKDIRTDIIATNIINDLEIYCVNAGCPWKGKLKDFSRHLKTCFFNPNEIPDYIKEVLNNKNDSNLDKINNDNKEYINNIEGNEGYNDNNLTSFNTKSSLRARLYNRNRELVNNIFSKSENKIKNTQKVNKNESEILKIIKENNINI